MERKYFYFGLTTTIFALGINLISIFGVVSLYVFYGGRIELAVLPFIKASGWARKFEIKIS